MVQARRCLSVLPHISCQRIFDVRVVSFAGSLDVQTPLRHLHLPCIVDCLRFA